MEWQLFEEGTVPEWTTPEWYAERDAAPHVEQDAHRPRLEVAAQHVRQRAYEGMTILDLGAGDGGLFTLLADLPNPMIGFDLQPDSVRAAAERGVDVRFGDVLDLPSLPWPGPGKAIAVCTEMIEHLLDPHGFLGSLRLHAETVVASSPAFETGDAHYEYHCWAWDQDGYRWMFEEAGWRVVAQETVGAFQVLTAVAV